MNGKGRAKGVESRRGLPIGSNFRLWSFERHAGQVASRINGRQRKQEQLQEATFSAESALPFLALQPFRVLFCSPPRQ